MSALAITGRLRPDRVGAAAAGVALGAAALILLAGGGPLAFALLGLVLVVLALWAFGLELLIGLTILAGAGLMPFLDASDNIVPQFKLYFISFIVASAAMLATWALREMAGRPAFALRWNPVLLAALIMACYVALALAATDPLAQPSLAAPYLQFPAMALVTYLWLSHPDALRGVRRALPIILAFVVVWELMYIGGAAGCVPCAGYVSADATNDGLLGEGSRLYAPGTFSLLIFAVISVAMAFRRATPLTVGFSLLSLATVAFMSSRAQYFALVAGLLVLIVWRLRNSRAGGRIALLAAVAVVAFAVASTPVGARAVAGYEDASAGSGTAGYRLSLVDRSRENWSILGAGITERTISLGVNEDLGLPNTLIVLGIVGAVLQIGLLLLAFVRGLSAGTLAGATLAAIFLTALVARPSLPIIELGHSSITFGAAVGAAAWLSLTRSERPSHAARG